MESREQLLARADAYDALADTTGNKVPQRRYRALARHWLALAGAAAPGGSAGVAAGASLMDAADSDLAAAV
jgi:hypothetical protein